MNRLKKQASTLQLLHKAKPNLRKVIIAKGDSQLIRCICDVALNVLSSNLPISPQHKKRLSRHKKSLRKLVDRKVSLQKKRHLIQTGGFLGSILAVAAPLITSLLGGLMPK